MENHMELSFIIPLYNTGKENLARCINSIINQEDLRFEVIVVDDGSKEEYARGYEQICAGDDRIQLLRIPNGGAANARNQGLRIAKGTYVCFVDSDDYMAPNGAVKCCLDTMVQDDLDLIAAANNEKGDDIRQMPTIEQMQILVLQQQYFSRTVQLGSPWAKIFKREFLLNKGVSFDARLRRSHDRLFMLNVLEAKPKYAISNEVLYYFCDDEVNSLSRGWNPKTKEYLMLFLEACRQFVDAHHSGNRRFQDSLNQLEMLLFRQCAHQVIFHPKNHESFSKRYQDYKALIQQMLTKNRVIVDYSGKGMYLLSWLLKYRLEFVSALCLELNRVMKNRA